MTGFDRALAATLIYEGGYVDKDDPGGETNRGITASTYNAYRDAQSLPRRSVRFLADGELRDIYRTRYSVPVTAGRIWPLNAVLFDVAVNSGVSTALWMLDQARPTVAPTDPDRMLKLAYAVLDVRAQFFRNLVIRRPSSAKFLRGWLRRCDQQRQLCGALRVFGLLSFDTLPEPDLEAYTPKTPEDYDPQAAD